MFLWLAALTVAGAGHSTLKCTPSQAHCCPRAQGCQGLVQFVGNASGHLPDGRQFSGLDQFVLGTAQGFFGLAPLANLAFEAFVAGAQVGRALSNFALQLAIGLL